MANMREIKLRIKSIKETRQITKAMKLISAAKLKKARQQLDQALPYFEKVRETIADIVIHSGSIHNLFFDLGHKKEGKKKGYIIITGDKGLAGGYNHNVIKFAEDHLTYNKEELLFVAGNTGVSYFNRKNARMCETFDFPVHNPTVFRAREIAEMIVDMFLKGELDEVYVIYTVMISTLKLEPQIMKLLPLDLEVVKKELDMPEDRPVKVDDSIIYEPSPQAVLKVLVAKYVKGIIYGAFTEAFASEQSARMTAMDNATANADEMLHKLNLHYNRARQAAITQEISEIVGGAAALK